MKIIIKCLNGQTFDLNIQGTDTIQNIKEKIQEIKQTDASLQKLLRKGQLLENTQTAQEIGICENDIIVLMTTVKKTQPPPQQQPIQAPIQQPVQQVQPQPPIQPIQQSKPTTAQVPQNAAQKSDYDSSIQNLISMGFSKPECEAALKAAYNNQDRAIDYLLNGIPQNVQNNQVPAQNQAQNQNQHLQEMIGQNHGDLQQLLPQLLAQLSQGNPNIQQQIAQNPEALLQMLANLGQNEGEEDDGLDIQITEDEDKQLNQLILMGFSKEDALEAFLTCDKNVETAASYLFEKQARGDLLSQHIQREGNHPEGLDENHFDDEEDDDEYEY